MDDFHFLVLCHPFPRLSITDDDNKENIDINIVMNENEPPDDVIIEESGKLKFLVALMKNLKDEAHRTLIFSQSRKMLDIIEKILSNKVCTLIFFCLYHMHGVHHFVILFYFMPFFLNLLVVLHNFHLIV